MFREVAAGEDDARSSTRHRGVRRGEGQRGGFGQRQPRPSPPTDATTLHLTFGSQAGATNRARQALTEVLDELAVPEPVLENARLVITELVANALVHGTFPFDVEIATWPGNVVVAVADNNPALPELRPTPTTRPHGRGLVIVDALADDWGVAVSASGGKTVWARIGWSAGSAEA